MRRVLSILLALLLVVGSVSAGFAASGGGSFDSDEFVKVKATGAVPDSSAGIAFSVPGTYTNTGINYHFYLVVSDEEIEEIDITIVGYPEEPDATPASVDYELGDDPYTGNVQQMHEFSIDVPDDLCEEGSTDATVDLDIKWYPPSGSSQEVMHGTIHFVCGLPEIYDLTVEKDGEGSTTPSIGTHSYEEDTVVDLLADPAMGWHFVEWEGPVASSGSADTTVTMTTDATVRAIFARNEYTLTVDHTGEGSTTPAGSSSRLYEDVVNLTADPATGWHFVEWEGPVADSDDPTTTVEILDDTHVTAVFARNKYTLTVDHTGQGSTTPDGTSGRLFEDVVNLTADPAPGWHFVEWLGPVADSMDPTTTVEILDDTDVTAVFERNEYQLYVYHTGWGSTTPDGTSMHAYEDVVDLTATPNSGWYFDSWIGPVADSNDPTTTITMMADATVGAVFMPIPLDDVVLTIEVEGEGTTEPSEGTHVVSEGTVVDLSAHPAMGWEFVRWDGPVASTGSATTSVTVTTSMTVTAVFEQIDYTLNVTHTGQGTTVPSGASTVHYGDVIDLTATPALDWAFSHWTGPVASSSQAMTTVMITGDTDVEAVFVYDPRPRYSVTTVASPPDGGTTTGDVVNVLAGTPYSLLAEPNFGDGYYFLGWGIASGPATIFDNPLVGTVASTMYYTAYFEQEGVQEVRLMIDSIGPGYTVPSEGTHWYPYGTTVDLEAIPDGFAAYFDRWVGSDASAVYYDDGYKIDMYGDREIAALFDTEIEMVTLTIDIDGGGEVDTSQGMVTSSRTFEVSPGTVVYMIPDADSGWYFDDWDGPDQYDVDEEGSGEYSILVDEDKEITADFNRRSTPPPPVIRHRLKISVEGNGTVAPFIGSQTYFPGTSVDVSADPANGWEFDGWIGPDGADVIGGQIDMDEDKTIIAKFVRETLPPPIEPPEIEIPLVEPPLGDGELPDTGQAIPWLTLVLGFCMTTFGYFFKKENE